MSDLPRDSSATKPGFAGLLDTLDRPAYVLSARGVVVYVNQAARELHETPPRWLRDALCAEDPSSCKDYRVIRLSNLGTSLWLVLLAPRRADANIDWYAYGLKPSLSRVATLVADGMRDKEIAALLGLSPATVRGYVTKIYRAVGVNNRTDLARLASRKLKSASRKSPIP